MKILILLLQRQLSLVAFTFVSLTAQAGATSFQCYKFLKPTPITTPLTDPEAFFKNELEVGSIDRLDVHALDYAAVKQEILGQNALARHYFSLSVYKHLLQQADPRLGELGLLVEKGGLCGPTCLTNIFIAKDFVVTEKKSLFWSENAPLLVEKIVEYYQKTMVSLRLFDQADARHGALLEYYINRESKLLKELGLVSNEVDPKASDHIFYKLKTNGILLGTVNFVNQPGAHRHAIVILGADTQNQRLLISDPNRPEKVILSPYLITPNKNLRFFLSPFYGGNTFVELDGGYILSY